MQIRLPYELRDSTHHFGFNTLIVARKLSNANDAGNVLFKVGTISSKIHFKANNNVQCDRLISTRDRYLERFRFQFHFTSMNRLSNETITTRKSWPYIS